MIALPSHLDPLVSAHPRLEHLEALLRLSAQETASALCPMRPLPEAPAVCQRRVSMSLTVQSPLYRKKILMLWTGTGMLGMNLGTHLAMRHIIHLAPPIARGQTNSGRLR